MAETPSPNEAFFREVDDAVRQDRLAGFWRRYGVWIAGLVAIGLAAFGGWLYWSHHSREVSGEVAEQAQDVLQSLASGGTPDETKMKALAAADQPGYRAMTVLAQAAVAVQKGDIKGAAKLYGDIAVNKSLPAPYRDLGTIRQVALTFDEMQPQQIVDRLKPLAVEGGPWFGSAAEMSAIAYMKMGKKDLAGPLFAAIAKDDKVPETLRSRARQMAGLLGVDAVDIDGGVEGNASNAKDEGDHAAGSE
ncbi:MAG: tetratricopeptide repeat protein [Sphingobium sp.]